MPLIDRTFSQIITFTRTGTTATYFNSAGVLTTTVADEPRFDYDPATLAARGFLIEEARTNSIRNNTMQGAVAGTPGTLPTNWSVFTSITGVTREIVGTGTENGITYIDVKLSGTPSSSGSYQVFPELSSVSPASSGQTWTCSAYFKLQSGGLTGISSTAIVVNERDSVGNLLVGTSTTFTPSSTLTRVSVTRTFTDALTARASSTSPFIGLDGAAIDITLRIGLPQLEQGAFATSVIPTTTTALTRSADVASVNTLSPWFNATEGTLFVEGTVGYTVPGSKFAVLASLNDGTSNNRIDVGYLTASAAALEVAAGGVSQVGMYPLNTSATRKVAGAYKLDDFAVSVNGSSPQTDTTGTVPIVDRLRLGDRIGVTHNILSGWLRRVSYYPRKLSSAELQSLTA